MGEVAGVDKRGDGGRSDRRRRREREGVATIPD